MSHPLTTFLHSRGPPGLLRQPLRSDESCNPVASKHSPAKILASKQLVMWLRCCSGVRLACWSGRHGATKMATL